MQSDMSAHSDPESLDELMLRPGADIRSPLLRTLVDLYLQKATHTTEEAQHFTELTLRLLDQADADTGIAMARRLAAYPSVPAAIKRRLTNHVPEVAALVRPACSGARADSDRHSPAREPVSHTELSELFFMAGVAERRLILVNLPYAPGPAAAGCAAHAGEAERQFETAALAHNPETFVHAVVRWLGITPALARRIVDDPLGEPIIVAAKFLGIAPDALQRILLFVNPAVGRSVSRVYELATLFNTIEVRAAHVMVGIWRAADPPRPAQADVAERGMRRTGARQVAAAPRDPANTPSRMAGS